MNRPLSGLCDALAKHFKQNRKLFRAHIEAQLPEYTDSPAVDLRFENHRFKVGISRDTTRIGELFYFKHLVKKDLYVNLLEMFDNEQVDFVVMYSNSTLLAVARDEEYRGLGGIFVRDKKSKVGYYFEPIANYLNHHYQVDEED